MKLHLPLVVAVLGVAGVAAAVRAYRAPTHDVASFSAETAAPAVSATRPPARRERAQVVVYVAGAVAKGGVYRLPAQSRAVDAVAAAGGVTHEADLVAVNLAAPLADGDEVVVPEKNASDDASTVADGTQRAHRKHKRHRKAHRKRHHRASHASEDAYAWTDTFAKDGAATTGASVSADAASVGEGPSAPIDLNIADANALETLPGVGDKLAERIVAFREINGPFAAPDDLLDVNGMTQKRLDALEPFVIVR